MNMEIRPLFNANEQFFFNIFLIFIFYVEYSPSVVKNSLIRK